MQVQPHLILQANPAIVSAVSTSVLPGSRLDSHAARTVFSNDYGAVIYAPGRREAGFKVGLPILSWEIGKTPSQKPHWTDYTEVEVHGFSLNGLSSDSICINTSVRCNKYERVPFTDRRWKRAEVNCDAVASVCAFVDDDHQIRYKEPVISQIDCSTSGIGVEQVIDYMSQGLTRAVTGGSASFGLFDLLAGIGMVFYDWIALLREESFLATGSVQSRVMLKSFVPFVKRMYELDDTHVDFFLKYLRYEPDGVWFMFGWTEALDEVCKGLKRHLPQQSGP